MRNINKNRMNHLHVDCVYHGDPQYTKEHVAPCKIYTIKFDKVLHPAQSLLVRNTAFSAHS